MTSQLEWQFAVFVLVGDLQIKICIGTYMMYLLTIMEKIFQWVVYVLNNDQSMMTKPPQTANGREGASHGW